MKTEQLSNYVDIVSGQIMTRLVVTDDSEGVGSWKVVIPKAITTDGFIDVKEMPEEKLKSEPPKERITRVGDIVIKLSTPFDSAVVTEESAGCVVPSFCAIIRCKDIHLNYVRAFLSSRYCREQLRAKVTGAVMSILSIGKIKSVEMPVPALLDQQRIGDEFNAAQERLVVMKQIMELERKRNDIIFQELVR